MCACRRAQIQNLASVVESQWIRFSNTTKNGGTNFPKGVSTGILFVVHAHALARVCMCITRCCQPECCAECVRALEPAAWGGGGVFAFRDLVRDELPFGA